MATRTTVKVRGERFSITLEKTEGGMVAAKCADKALGLRSVDVEAESGSEALEKVRGAIEERLARAKAKEKR